MPAVPCLKSNSQTTNHIRGWTLMLLMCYTVLGGNVDVTLRHWSGQTSKPRIWQAIDLSEFNGVIIPWYNRYQSLVEWWNPESWYHVISQHNGGSQRELLLASPLSQCFFTCFTCAPPWAFCIDTHIAEVHLPVPQAALNAFQAITLPVRHGNGNRKMRQWHSEQSAIPTKY